MAAANAAIGGIRNRWDVRGSYSRKRAVLTFNTPDATERLDAGIGDGNQ